MTKKLFLVLLHSEHGVDALVTSTAAKAKAIRSGLIEGVLGDLQDDGIDIRAIERALKRGDHDAVASEFSKAEWSRTRGSAMEIEIREAAVL